MTIFLLCASLYTEARHTITVPEAETDDPTPPGARKEQSNAELTKRSNIGTRPKPVRTAAAGRLCRGRSGVPCAEYQKRSAK